MAVKKPAAAGQPGAGSSEQGSWYGDFRHLERDMTGVMERVEGPVLTMSRSWDHVVGTTALPPKPTSQTARPLSWRGGPLYLRQPTPLGEVHQDRF